MDKIYLIVINITVFRRYYNYTYHNMYNNYYYSMTLNTCRLYRISLGPYLVIYFHGMIYQDKELIHVYAKVRVTMKSINDLTNIILIYVSFSFIFSSYARHHYDDLIKIDIVLCNLLSEILFNRYHAIETPHGAGKQRRQYSCCLREMYYNVTRITETLNLNIECIMQTPRINKKISGRCNIIIHSRYIIEFEYFSKTYLNLYIYYLIVEQHINKCLEKRYHLLVVIYVIRVSIYYINNSYFCIAVILYYMYIYGYGCTHTTVARTSYTHRYNEYVRYNFHVDCTQKISYNYHITDLLIDQLWVVKLMRVI